MVQAPRYFGSNNGSDRIAYDSVAAAKLTGREALHA
jgi:hypothetical protein